MKILMLKLLMLIFAPLALAQQGQNIQQVSFESTTRGFQRSISITPDSIKVLERGRTEQQPVQQAISPQQWQSVVASLKSVELSQLEQLKAPTNKRAYDGALHSSFTISTNSASYHTASFDDHEPPKPLQALMQAVLKLAEEVD